MPDETAAAAWLENPRIRAGVKLFIHAFIVALAWSLAVYTRMPVGSETFETWLVTLPLALATAVPALLLFRLPMALWRYFGRRDAFTTVGAAATAAAFQTVAILFLRGHAHLSRWILALYGIYLTIGMLGARALLRLLRERIRRPQRDRAGARRVLIVGAGDTAELLLREFERSIHLDYRVVGFVDDDPAKIGARLAGLPVFGPIARITEIARDCAAEVLILAIPSLRGESLLRVFSLCEATGLPIRRVPTLHELVDGAGSIVALRNVPPEELLPRPRFTADPQHLHRAVAGRRFLVTGAAGSIGSELCRALCRLGAAHVTLLDRAESPMHDLLRELRSACGGVEITAALVDILEAPRLKDAVERARPDVIFHAAAYKHVPLMEERPLEAARNNVLGTLRVAQAAEEAGVPRAVLISTDKAVRPASIMGATKRIAEEMVLRRAGPTRWSAVRFGNVIGSQGSVLRVFEAQLYDGKPLTVTSEKATRYFILPSEAVHLLILAADIAKPGDLLVLDMGRPVAIGDLARNLVRLAGLRPGRDIALERTGLKPGEKTEEELTDEGERLEATSVPRVWRVCAQTAPPFITQEDIHRLLAAAEQFDEQNARALLCSSVRTRGDCVPSTGTSVPEGR